MAKPHHVRPCRAAYMADHPEEYGPAMYTWMGPEWCRVVRQQQERMQARYMKNGPRNEPRARTTLAYVARDASTQCQRGTGYVTEKSVSARVCAPRPLVSYRWLLRSSYSSFSSVVAHIAGRYAACHCCFGHSIRFHSIPYRLHCRHQGWLWENSETVL